MSEFLHATSVEYAENFRQFDQERRRNIEARLEALFGPEPITEEDAHYDDIAWGMECAANDALDRW